MGSFIIMEFIERAGPVDQGQLGVNLAAMHEATPVVRRVRGSCWGKVPEYGCWEAMHCTDHIPGTVKVPREPCMIAHPINEPLA